MAQAGIVGLKFTFQFEGITSFMQAKRLERQRRVGGLDDDFQIPPRLPPERLKFSLHTSIR